MLRTPPIARVVPARVFDAFAWCASDELEWRRPPGVWDDATQLDGSNPTRMVFVFHEGARCEGKGEGEGEGDGDDGAAFLPRELARLHATGLGLRDEEALAPWGIDAATDGLFERRLRPREVLWLAADNLNALFWGLHDWAHFHSHGPFEERAWTELQCDVSALAWLWVNRAEVGLTDEVWERLRLEVVALTKARFESEEAQRWRLSTELPERTLDAEQVKALVASGSAS